ncbi:MAG: histidine phosphatase family protein [Gemmatimonadota bacterium]
MRRLLLLRHAKSSWDDASLDDFERPLAARGRNDAPRMARYLWENDLLPDVALCSPARRAAETWEAVAPLLGGRVPVEYDRSLYMAAPSTLLRLVQSQPLEHSSVLVLGHNPGLEEAACRLVVDGSERDLERMTLKYPTCALAVIDFPCELWGEVDWGQGRLQRFVRPRDLNG